MQDISSFPETSLGLLVFNIYVSDTNLFPDIMNNSIKHYGINLYGYSYEKGENKIAKISFFTTKNIAANRAQKTATNLALNISI